MWYKIDITDNIITVRNLSSEEQKEILLNKISEIRECIKKIKE